MEAFPLVTPSTRYRVVSAGPRRSSMEDSDSSLTRKRPRLDSGSRPHRSMSADRIMDATPDYESDTPHPMSPRDILSTKVTSQNSTTQAVDGTPSRVTINVKDPRFRAPPLMPTKHGGEKFDELDSYKDELANSSEPEPSNKLVSLSPHMISPPSSPSRSPEIEVAEVEDMNQEPGNTRWRPLSDIADPVKIRDDLWAIFPCRAPSQNVLDAADELARHFHQGRIIMTSYLFSAKSC